MHDHDATDSGYSRRSVLGGVALATAGGVSGCLAGLGGRSPDATETTTATYVTDHADALALTTTRGDVIVRGTRTDQVELTVRAAATDGDELDDVTTDVSLVGGTLRITADTGGASATDLADSTRADLELTVPRSLPLTAVKAPRGDVDIRGVRSVADIDASGGGVVVDAVDGAVGVDASSGRVTLTDVSGPVTVESATGDVTVRDATGPVEATTSSGAVTVTDAADTVTVVTTTGDVDVATVAGRVEVDTAVGDIRVRSIRGDAVLTTTTGDIKASGVDGEVLR